MDRGGRQDELAPPTRIRSAVVQDDLDDVATILRAAYTADEEAGRDFVALFLILSHISYDRPRTLVTEVSQARARKSIVRALFKNAFRRRA